MNSTGTNSQKFPKYKKIPEIKQYLDTYTDGDFDTDGDL